MRHIRHCILALFAATSVVYAETPPPTSYFRFGYNPATQEEVHKGMQDIGRLIFFFCENIYPKPTEMECIENVKRGIGASADPHSEYMSPSEAKRFAEGVSGQFGGVGIEMAKLQKGAGVVLVTNVVDASPAQRAGILAGDIITHIVDQHNVSRPTTSLAKTDDVVSLIRGTPGTPVRFLVSRAGVSKTLEFSLVREVIRVAQVEGDLVLAGGKTYALIKNKTFGRDNARDVEAKFLELRRKSRTPLAGLILSYENNGGGLLEEAYHNIKLFVETEKDIILIRTNTELVPYVPPVSRGVFRERARDITMGLPILVVVNGSSASASEVVAKALKHHRRALIAGVSETFGKGIVQSSVPRNDGSIIKLTTSEYLIGSLDDWVPVQCTGVGPDVFFEYPGIKKPDFTTECSLSGHVNTLGTMQHPPVRLSLKDVNRPHHDAGIAMLEAYKAYQLPRLLELEAKRKLIEQE